MKQSTIAVIGAGSVGTTTAYALLLQNIAAKLLLIDINETRCYGEILDLADALPFCDTSAVRGGSLTDAAQADIIIIAAGKRQEPGQKREELIQTNKKIIIDIITAMQPINSNAIIIMVTNPVDILTCCAQKVAQLPRTQVFGSGTYLDSQRLRGLLAKKLNVSEESIDAYVLGEHGDSQVVAWSTADISGKPLSEYKELTPEIRKKIAQETRERAYEIIKCKGATFFGVATCVADVCAAILFNQKRAIPVSCFIEKYSICLSMPAIIGEKGIKEIIMPPLDHEEEEELRKSVEKLKKLGC